MRNEIPIIFSVTTIINSVFDFYACTICHQKNNVKRFHTSLQEEKFKKNIEARKIIVGKYKKLILQTGFYSKVRIYNELYLVDSCSGNKKKFCSIWILSSFRRWKCRRIILKLVKN